MPDRREFLKAAGAGVAWMGAGRGAFGAPADAPGLSYAIHAEQFWRNLPFLDRLRKASEAGFSRYEFWRWKAKDIDAIAKLGDELGIQAALFTGYWGTGGPKWKEGLLESVADSAELAPRLGATRLAVVPPTRDGKADREEQVEDLVDALKEAAEKVAESEATLILEPGLPGTLLATPEEAAAVVKAVGSPRVRFALEIRRRQGDEPESTARIRGLKDQVGYYRLGDIGQDGPAEGRVDYPAVLKAIRATGYADPVGVGLRDRVDPGRAIDALRKADAAAKAP